MSSISYLTITPKPPKMNTYYAQVLQQAYQEDEPTSLTAFGLGIFSFSSSVLARLVPQEGG